jgi:hypothetical protein
MARAEPAAPVLGKVPNPKRIVPASQGTLEKLIETYLVAEGVAKSRFGRDVMGDPKFLTSKRITWQDRTRLRLTKFFLDQGYLRDAG